MAEQSVDLTLRHGVDIEGVHSAVAELIRIMRPRGCTACGLIGIDIHIHGGDPELFEQLGALRKNEAVLSVSALGPESAARG